MKKLKKFRGLLLSALLLLNFRLSAESFEFVDSDIGEILYAVSLYKGFPVSADDTVSGKGSFRAVGDDFDDDFDAFLDASRLYVEKGEGRWVVSKIRFLKGEGGFFSLDACDVPPARLFECVALNTGVCVTHENLPQGRVSVHTGFCSPEEIVRRVAGLCPGFEASMEETGFLRVSRAEGAKSLSAMNGRAEFSVSGGVFSCDIQNSPLSFVVERLCSVAGREYCFSLSTDARILRANFTADGFDEVLSRICSLAGAKAVSDGKIYFLTNSRDKEKLLESGRKWREASVRCAKPKAVLELSSRRFPEIRTLDAGNGKFMYLASDSEDAEFLEFLSSVDVPPSSRLVQLKFIRTADFFKNLPPFLDKGDVFDSGRGDSFYFTGSDEAFENLRSHMAEFDRPVSRVSYDLLIMQYQDTDGSDWKPSFRAGRLSLGDMNEASASLGSVLDLNLDVVSAFGLKFAASLQSAISSSKAKVFADTTLNGVSGSSISFQNTNTYRYRDNNLDPETGEPVYSGVTKEIVSGLKLEVTGVVTGDGMITSKITASVSRQGTDLSSTTGNPPPSSEKVVTTEVRAASGEPVVLSGLVQEEEGEAVSRTPVLSRIPLVGRLFRSTEKSMERTELVIYLVPTAEVYPQDSAQDEPVKTGEDERIRSLYREFVSGGKDEI